MIYDPIVGKFAEISPSAFWRYPSPIHPFFLVKDGRIQDCDCPDLAYYINILTHATREYLDDIPNIRPSSSLPPSSPPPSTPVGYAEAAVQATEAIVPQKRRRSGSQSATGAHKAIKVEVNLHVHPGGSPSRRNRSPKQGTGKSVNDPIVVV